MSPQQGGVSLSEILAHTKQRIRQAHTAQVSEWYRITAKAEAGDRSKAKVYIYDAIGGWFGVAASQFVRDLNALDVAEIELHVNSPGGSAFDGLAIMNALKQHNATVTTFVDGLAASAASLVALGGDRIVMTTGSQMMIHDASTLAYGNAKEMRTAADTLDQVSAGMADVYAKRAGGTSDEWRAVMKAETWYGAAEAVTAGLADAVDEDTPAVNAAFDLTIFAHAGRDAAPAPTFPGRQTTTLTSVAAGGLAPAATAQDSDEAAADLLFAQMHGISTATFEDDPELQVWLAALADDSPGTTPTTDNLDADTRAFSSALGLNLES